MIPIRDDAPRFSTPYVNYFLVASNILVFLLMWLGVPAPAQQLANQFGFVPEKITAWFQGVHYLRLHGYLVPVNSASAFVPVFTPCSSTPPGCT